MKVKSNKGFSLVELLVAMAVLSIVMIEVFNVMSNSSKLYIKGSSEIGLQSEAQQVILQLEDLLVDCTGVVAPDHELANAETFTISSNSVNYIINYVRDPADDYGQLQLSVPGASNIPLSDYVNSISVNMANYKANNIVTLCVSMNNGTYSYETTQDVFLRNMPGTGIGKRGTPAAASSGSGLEVARYHTYQLKNECIEDITKFEEANGAHFNFIFEWDAACVDVLNGESMKVGSLYSLSTSGSLEAKTYVNKEYGKEFGFDVGYTINCYADDKNTPVVERTPVTSVDITTPKVQVGLGSAGKNGSSPYGYGIMFPWCGDSSHYFSAIAVKGIDISACTKMVVNVDIVHPRSGSDYRFNWKSATINGLPIGGTELKDSAFNVTNSQMCIADEPAGNGGRFIDHGINNDSLWVDKSGISADEYGTCLLVHTARMLNPERYYKLIQADHIVELRCKAEYPGGDLYFNIYCMPNNENPSSELDAVQNKAYQIIDSLK